MLRFDMSKDNRSSLMGALSEGQLDVLRLVAQHMSSKEIARELGISPNTVDQRLKRVQFILGVSGRFEAARMYSAWISNAATDDPIWGDLVYQRPGLFSTPPIHHQKASPGCSDLPSDGSGSTLQQPQAAFIAAPGWQQGRRSWSMILLEAGQRNELTPLARTVCIGGITLAALLSVAAAIALTEGLSRLF